MSRILALANKEFLQIRRDHVLLRLIILLPVVLLILFGYALNTSLKNIPLSVVDHSSDRVSAIFLKYFTEENRFRLIPTSTVEAALQEVKNGKTHGILEVEEGALKALRDNKPIKFTLRIDGSDPQITAQIRAQASASMQDFTKKALAGRALTENISAPVEPTFETLYNPDNRTAVFMVPGIVGLILAQITTLLTSIGVVREREVGTLESLIATPIRPSEVILGKMLPYFILGLFDAALILALGHWVFGVPLVGNLGLIVLAAFLFVLVSQGIGILISSSAKTQVQAMFGSFAILFPSIFLSGMLFPIEGMNRFFQALSYAVPLKYFLEIMRGVMLRGTGLDSLWLQFTCLSIFAVLMVLLASLRFRKTL
ncbi:ABC transporter permease [Deinococcus roseus]|uniref:Transport permease protein n=1 Tax=Deinococcus roseus TaxID=392414 RepID=A0ABQ2D301_9DEIO|nr:ABC transporter permease [Deinococcus roseus]GGJ34427.1 transport permease protein [Deinococcus roseus]